MKANITVITPHGTFHSVRNECSRAEFEEMKGLMKRLDEASRFNLEIESTIVGRTQEILMTKEMIGRSIFIINTYED